jgi:GAF domain-containing protein
VALIVATRSDARLLDAARRRAAARESQLAEQRETGRARTAALDRQIRRLSAVASISRDISFLSDLDTLLSRTVSLTADHLGLYHVGAYVLDERGEWLDLWASADPEAEDPPPWEPRVRSAGPSTVGRVATTSVPYLASDARAERQEEDNGGFGRTRARLTLPIRSGARVLGVLDMHSAVQGAFEPDDADVFAMLADQVAAVWMHAVALREAQEHGESMRAAHARSVAESWRRAVQARRPAGVVRTPQGLAAAAGAWRGAMIDALRSGEIVVSGEDRRSVAVPVSVRGEVVAVLQARRPRGADPWAQQDLTLLRTLSVQLGEALENARLYEDVRRRETQERLLGEATARMRASLDPQTVLRVGAQEIRDALGLAALDIRVDLAHDSPGEASPPE